jgi:hypothetical protein
MHPVKRVNIGGITQLITENVTDWCQSMSGCFGVVHSGLRLAGGTLQMWMTFSFPGM